MTEKNQYYSATRKKQIQPEIDICQRCHKEITDRQRLGFVPIRYCVKCRRDIHNEYLCKRYKERHPKKATKQELIIKKLKKKPSTIKELMVVSKIKKKNTLRVLICQLRERGYNIQAIHFMPSHYVLVNPK